MQVASKNSIWMVCHRTSGAYIFHFSWFIIARVNHPLYFTYLHDVIRIYFVAQSSSDLYFTSSLLVEVNHRVMVSLRGAHLFPPRFPFPSQQQPTKCARTSTRSRCYSRRCATSQPQHSHNHVRTNTYLNLSAFSLYVCMYVSDQTRDFDRDERYMATSDLCVELDKDVELGPYLEPEYVHNS